MRTGIIFSLWPAGFSTLGLTLEKILFSFDALHGHAAEL